MSKDRAILEEQLSQKDYKIEDVESKTISYPLAKEATFKEPRWREESREVHRKE